jgi:PAS domain S-box-containing protein
MKNTKNNFFIPFIVFAILILIVAFTLKNIYELNNDSKWVVQTNEVKTALANNLSLLIDMETGQRGFALTGNRDFLEYENLAKAEIQKNILHLQQLLKDNPSQLLKLDSLKQVIELKIAFNGKVIEAREQFGLNAAVAIISIRRGKQIMDGARKLSDNMLEVEEKLLNDRKKIVAHSYFLAQISVIVGGIISILIAIFLIIMNNKSLKLKNNILQSEKKFKSIFDNSLAAVLVTDDKGNYLSANKAAGKLLGYSVNELLQMNVGDLKTAAKPGAAKLYEEYIRKGEETGEFDFITKNGEHKLAQYQASRTTPNFNLSVLMDITKQKQASQYARSLIEASLDPLVTISAEGKITDVNEASVEVTGEIRENLIGTDFSDYFTEPEKAREGYKQVFEKGFVSDYPLTIHHKNGKLTDVLYNATIYKDDKGNVLGVFAAARDVTEQKQASQYARSLIEASLDPLVTISAEGKITDVNEASVKVTGETREKLIGTDFSGYFTEPEKAREGYKQVFEKGFVSDYPLTIHHKNGKLTDVLYNATIYKDDKGNVLGVFAAARDVTEQKAEELSLANKELILQNKEKEKQAAILEIANIELKFQNDEKEKRAAELIIANKELAFQNDQKEKRAAKLIIANKELLFQNEEKEKRATELTNANKELESFNYISSHDLQEPLRKIQIFSTRLVSDESQNLSDKGKEYVLRIEAAAKRMRTLIDDLLAYSRTTSSERKFITTSLAPIIEAVKNDFEEIITAKKATIEIGEMCDARIIPFQFDQLMHNLIGNALKFSSPDRPPHIKIISRNIKGSKVKDQKLLSEEEYCHITVTDNGIGFAPQYKDHIFEIFKRLHDKEKITGTGIGLTIAKKIVENHNGVIIATGELNKGASFDIYIPLT